MSEVERSSGTWEFTMFGKPDGSGIKTVQDVVETTAYSAMQSESAELWGVSLPTKDHNGAVLVVCYTGNGPRSRANAEFISRACNSHDDLLKALKAQQMANEAGEEKMPFKEWLDLESAAKALVNAAIAKAERPL